STECLHPPRSGLTRAPKARDAGPEDKRDKRGVMLRDDPYTDRGWSRHDDDGGYDEPRGGFPWRKLLIGFGVLVGVGFLAVVGFILAALQGLPSLADLQDYEPPVTSRVYAGDGALVAEFAREQRVFVP